MDYLQYIIPDHPRFTNYEAGRKLYLGQHYEYFGMDQYEYFQNGSRKYLVYNYPEVMTNAFCNLIWSEVPEIDLDGKSDSDNTKNQTFIDNWIDENSIMTTLRECSETASSEQEAVVRLRVIDGQVTLEQLDNRIWFPIYDANNPGQKAKGHIIKYEKKVGDSGSERVYWLLEIHTAGMIEWQSFEIVDKKPIKQAVMQNWASEMNTVLIQKDTQKAADGDLYYTTNCKLPLVFHLKNNSISNEFFGVSDYTRAVISKVFAINSNLNQIQSVLRRHANPKMVVTAKLIKQASQEVQHDNEAALKLGFANKQAAIGLMNREGKDYFATVVGERLLRNMEFIPSDINSGETKYLTWDGNLIESREQIKTLKQNLFEETQLAKVLIDPDVSTGSASGVAIMRMAQSSLHKAEKKQSYLRAWIKQIIYSVLELAQNLNLDVDKPEYPSIKFRDGLVNDMMELITEETAKLDAGIQSKVGAISRIYDCSDEQAQTTYDEIQAENDVLGGDSPIVSINAK